MMLCCAYLHLTLCGSMDCSPLGYFVHGISQARVLEWVAISYFRGVERNPNLFHLLQWQVDSLTLSVTCKTPVIKDRNVLQPLLRYISIETEWYGNYHLVVMHLPTNEQRALLYTVMGSLPVSLKDQVYWNSVRFTSNYHRKIMWWSVFWEEIIHPMYSNLVNDVTNKQ